MSSWRRYIYTRANKHTLTRTQARTIFVAIEICSLLFDRIPSGPSFSIHAPLISTIYLVVLDFSLLPFSHPLPVFVCNLAALTKPPIYRYFLIVGGF